MILDNSIQLWRGGLLIVYILDTNLAMAVTADVTIGDQYNISNLPVQELQL